MLYYSQNFEDVYLWRCFKEIKNGFYVDVGAYDPVFESVTKVFYDSGWTGVNIDPSKSFLPKFTKARPKDINHNLLAWDSDNESIAFYESEDTGRSTAIHHYKEACEHDKIALNKRSVPTSTLDTILSKVEYSDFHFLKIDAEGSELKVLTGLNLQLHRPQIIILEAIDPRQVIADDDNAISNILQANGYSLAMFDGLNKYWCSNEYPHFKHMLENPPGCQDGIRPYQVFEAQQRAAALEYELNELRKTLRLSQLNNKQSFLLISHSSPGLMQDKEVVGSLLIKLGHTVRVLDAPSFYFQQNIPLQMPEDILNSHHVIMFEHAYILSGKALSHSLYVNPEWLLPDDIAKIEAGYVDFLLTKSRDAETRLANKFSNLSIIYTGFSSLLLSYSAIRPNYNLAIHARGYARQKGTITVLKAYRSVYNETLPPCVCTMRCFDDAVPSFNAKIGGSCDLIFRDINPSAFEKMARKRGIHLCPSEREGFGHYIFGPMSAGCIVVTSNAPPMNEIVDESCGILLESEIIEHELYCDAVTRPEVMRSALKGLNQMSFEEKSGMGAAAMSKAKLMTEDFEQRLNIFLSLLQFASPRESS